MTFAELRRRAGRLLARTFDLDAPPDGFLANPYKLCDAKPLYPELFYELGADLGVAADDFVGWGDCDLIYGRLSDVLDGRDDVHLIGGHHGHFTALRNTAALRGLFARTPDLVADLCRPDYRVVDEGSFRAVLFDHLREQGLRAHDLHLEMCDVVPEVFWGLFRPDHASRATNFFETYRPEQEIDHVLCGDDGRLTVIYTDGTTRSAAYCHLQKRHMALCVEPSALPFRIEESCLAPQLRRDKGSESQISGTSSS